MMVLLPRKKITGSYKKLHKISRNIKKKYNNGTEISCFSMKRANEINPQKHE